MAIKSFAKTSFDDDLDDASEASMKFEIGESEKVATKISSSIGGSKRKRKTVQNCIITFYGIANKNY